MIYLDFAKAFDKVDHGVLMHKLKGIGVSGNFGVWMGNILRDRTSVFELKVVLAIRLASVTSGVPQ